MEKVLVIDYGGQYTHLIARRCREVGVYAEVVHQDTKLVGEDLGDVKGVIMSGGPRTVSKDDLGQVFQSNLTEFRSRNIHILGICFGHQLLAVSQGAVLVSGNDREYGKARIKVLDRQSILRGLKDDQDVWMSHGDEVQQLPKTCVPLAVSGQHRIAAFSDTQGMIFGVQFHPEVAHTPNGISVIRSFLRDSCGYVQTWLPESQIDQIVESIGLQVGQGRVLMATSGGVDSTVAAELIRRAIGDRLFCVFVDNGLLREGEREEVEKSYTQMDFDHFYTVDASDDFLNRLHGIEDPEEKRRIIAETFICTFEKKARELESQYGVFEFLGQGTIYPDRVESAATGKATAVIKSHHNVRLPDSMRLRLVEPLKDLYKDEVRRVALHLGLPDDLVHRQPFPGPSLAIRMGGPVTREQLDIVRRADRILQEELRKEPIYESIWQSFCVLLPARSVGVMGDARTYDQAAVIRIVESTDAMTASVSTPDWSALLRIASRIVNEVRGVNRVTYDLTTKPPGTIEWY